MSPTYKVIDRFKKEVVDRGLSLLDALVYVEKNQIRYYIEKEEKEE